MPTSGGIFDDRIENLLKKYKFKSYLDIGPGEGKYGKIIRKLYPKAHITGVEPYEGYHKFLKDYDRVIKQPAQDMIGTPGNYDLVIMGDVIEHLRKSDALDFLNYIIYKCKKIIIIFPTAYIQESEIPWENHISLWSENDFYSFEIAGGFNVENKYKMVILNGLLEDK